MRRLKRTLLGVSIAAAFGVPLTFAGLAAGAGKINIAVFYYNPSPYGIASYKAAQIEAKKLGGVSITAFDANNDPDDADHADDGRHHHGQVQGLLGVGAQRRCAKRRRSSRPRPRASRSPSPTTRSVTSTPSSRSRRRKGLVSTIGGNIGVQEQAFVKLIEEACTAKVGATGNVQRRVHAGARQLPDRHAARAVHAGGSPGEHQVDDHASW